MRKYPEYPQEYPDDRGRSSLVRFTVFAGIFFVAVIVPMLVCVYCMLRMLNIMGQL